VLRLEAAAGIKVDGLQIELGITMGVGLVVTQLWPVVIAGDVSGKELIGEGR
jgi:hypothetical protein